MSAVFHRVVDLLFGLCFFSTSKHYYAILCDNIAFLKGLR
jgi:hypothetical protein